MTTTTAASRFDPHGRLLFAERQHQYFLDPRENRRELISVTKTFEIALDGTLGEEYWTEEARLRGSHTHQAILYHSQRDLDVSSLHPIVAPYFAGYLRFVADCQPEILHAEQPIFDEPAGYAGTFDLLCHLNGPYRTPGAGVLDLVDVKSGTVPWTVGMQLAAYKRAVQLAYPGNFIRRWALHLRADGTYKLDEVSRWTDARDHERQFLAVLLTAQLKRQHA